MLEVAKGPVTNPGMAPIFQNRQAITRKCKVFIDVNIKMPAMTGGKVFINTFRDLVTEWYQLIHDNIDDSFVILNYLGKDAEEKDALMDPSQLGKNIMVMRKYFGNLRPMTKEGYAHLNLRVTFDQEPLEETVHDMHTISQGKAQVYLTPLQAANTEKIRWLHPTHRAQCLHDYEKLVNKALSHLHNGTVQMQGYWKTQDPDPLKVALIWKPIYNGMTKEKCAKEVDGVEAVWAIHVIAKKSDVHSVTGAMDFILSLPSYTAVNKLGTAMVPQYQRNSGMAAKLKLLKVIKKQKYFQDRIYMATLDGALGLDLVNLKGQMLRKFVMDTKRNDTNTDLFLDCNPSWDEMSFTVSYSKKFTKEASFKSSNIAAYAFHAFGDMGLQWFSPNMAVVKTMGWVFGFHKSVWVYMKKMILQILTSIGNLTIKDFLRHILA